MNRKKILIAEDERIIAEDVKRTLQNLGYTVSSIVSSGKEAVKKAKEDKPDLVLMDIVLRGEMDGIEAAHQIQSEFDIPVVYLTAYADEKILERAKITEPFGYILKPFEDRELQITIEIALYKHRMEKKLKESKEWLSTTLKSIADAVIATDEKGQVAFINPLAEVLTGWKQEDAAGKPLEDVFNIITEEKGERLENPVVKVIREGKAVSTSNYTILIAKDETKRPINYSIAPIRDSKGKISRVVLAFQDITERKRAEKELQQSFEKLQKTLQGTIHALASTVEIRDPYTAGHQKRVTQLACAIAKEMGISKEQINGLRFAAAIHDIGKIQVPSEILAKPGKLTRIEFAMIKNHPQAGYEILKEIDFPWPLAKIILQHHERMDGSGYPQGLLGKEIILEARILAVADVVETISSHRPYRPALGINKALKEISQKRGILYDSRVVDACLKLFTQKGFRFE